MICDDLIEWLADSRLVVCALTVVEAVSEGTLSETAKTVRLGA
jgi:hypothetical protein